MGSIVWPSINFATPYKSYRYGKGYGSFESPFIIGMISETQRDYIEINYITTEDEGNSVSVWIVDRIGYNAILQGYSPSSYTAIDTRIRTPEKFKVRHYQSREDFENKNELYFVWKVWSGGIMSVQYEYTKTFFRELTGFTWYFLSGILLFAVLYLTYYILHTKYPEVFSPLCIICKNKIAEHAEYCPHCGKVFHEPNVDKIIKHSKK